MFTPPYIPPKPPKPEEEKSIFRNGLNIFMNGIYAGIAHSAINIYNAGILYMAIKDPEAGIITKVAGGTLVTSSLQTINWIIHEVASENTEKNKIAKKQKIKYKNAIENNDANLVYKLEEEQKYLIKWGKNFIKDYDVVKPRQLLIPYKNFI